MTYKNEILETMLEYYETYTDKKATKAQYHVLREYNNTKRSGFELFAITDVPFESGVQDFVRAVELAEITELALCNHSTGLMATLQGFIGSGWRVVGNIELETEILKESGLRMKRQ